MCVSVSVCAHAHSHLNSVVRKCTGQHMATLVEKIGASRVLSGGKDLTDRILPAVTRLAQDSSQEARWALPTFKGQLRGDGVN